MSGTEEKSVKYDTCCLITGVRRLFSLAFGLYMVYSSLSKPISITSMRAETVSFEQLWCFGSVADMCGLY
jgi:hypothetical protein